MKIKEEKKKGILLGSLFVLMMLDFITTFIGVGFLGFKEVNIVPRFIISVFGFWLYFIFIILVFILFTFFVNLNYKI